jgi:pimeloyl-ACP methyl ester carboxylesterase
MTRAHPLPGVEAATARHARDQHDDNLGAIAVASAPWNFTPAGLAAGRALLARMPCNGAAADWSDAHFDHTYEALWWPTDIPVFRLAGADDRIAWQGGWGEARFHGANLMHCLVPDAGHFPWIENPLAIRDAFGQPAAAILRGAAL